MNLKRKILIILLLLTVLTISSVSASDDINFDDNLTVSDEGILQENPYEEIELNNNEINDNSVSESDTNNNLAEEGEFVNVSDAYTYLNTFRCENGVWQWDEGDVTKTVFNTNSTNQLKPLVRYDALEETAKIRAKEIAQTFSHDRPDGTKCYTAFPSGLYAMGENIAYGQTSTYAVTEAWKETNDPYSGQGHRRNMLDPKFNCIGIAGYKINGIIYWVQDFGYDPNIKDTPTNSSNTPTNTTQNNTTPTNSNNTNTNTTQNNTTPVQPVTKTILVLKKVSVKKSAKKLSIQTTLKIDGKAVKGKIIKFKFNKKTYTAKTSAKGVAKITVKKSVLKKLKAGKKITYTATYNGITKKVTVKVKK